MSDLSARLAKLSPEQRALLETRLGRGAQADAPMPDLGYGLFFFSAAGEGRGRNNYRLLLESAEAAEAAGLHAIWTPERHFQQFGGLYPNPSVISAALAMVTKQVRLRAGSCVAPLHSPVRIAEEWAVVDNLSDGRVDLAFATGWHAHDYVIRAENYPDRRNLMFETLDIVRRLWRGDQVPIPGVEGQITDVRTLPRPVQPELPCWVTAVSKRSFEDAGRLGANILTMKVVGDDVLGKHITAYRDARINAGHDPRTGVVTLMMHTHMDTDEERARSACRKHLSDYLGGFLDQYQALPGAERFEDREGLLDFAFERYYSHDALLGPPEKCAALIRKMAKLGVNDIACLVDFGPSLEEIQRTIEHLQGFVHKG